VVVVITTTTPYYNSSQEGYPMLPMPFKLERYFAKYEFSVRYLLCASDCESLTVNELLALEPGAAERFGQLWLGYTETQGGPALRAEIAKLYTTIAPQEVLVHPGAEEAIFLFMQAVLEPGDHIVVHWPCYQSHFEIARSRGCSFTAWSGREEDGWALDPDELRRLLRPNTRAIVINTPHNPTGYLMAPDVLREVVRIAEERGIWLFSDEVYRECEYDPRQRLPSAADLGQRCITLGTVSKTYGLPGLRIGWLAGHDSALLSKISGLKDYTTICASAPSEFLTEVALRQRQVLIDRTLTTIRHNLGILDGFFTRQAARFQWARPGAGPIGFPRLIGEGIEAFSDRLVRQSGVLLLPGTIFDDPSNHFRLGFGRKNMPEAVARLEEFLKQ
jgi:aspartate/methionine/tyrosine aminotransferase